MAYNMYSRRILFERYKGDWEKNVWVLEEKEEWIYDSAGRTISCEIFGARYGNGKYYYKYDNNGNQCITYYYDLVNNEWKLQSYTISYPNNGIPEAEVSNNNPIDNNQGSFDLDINISIDSINNGSIIITLPEGFTLDEKNTSLTLDFEGLFELKITKQENNSWLLEINPKSVKSGLLSAETSTKMLHIAYKVDEKLKKGDYDISLNSILFETKGGNFIPEPAIIVPVNVNRWGIGNEYLNVSEPVVYTFNNTLYIKTPYTEQIFIFSISGAKLYETKAQPGTTTIDVTGFPKGFLIVKGSVGWSKKVIIN